MQQFTKFLNTKHFTIHYETESYHRLNRILENLYGHYRQGHTSFYDIYEFMQKIDWHARSDWRERDSNALESFANNIIGKNNVWSNDDGCWSAFKFTKNDESPYCSEQVKVYLTKNDLSIRDMFLDLVQYLLQNGIHSFSCKLTRYKRDDHICFWMYSDDFFLFEKYAAKYADCLIKSQPFIAYRGPFGINRDLKDANSYNGNVALMAKRYFENVNNTKELDVCKMLDFFLKDWNGEIEKDESDWTSFSKTNCQVLLVILESFDLILSECEMPDNHLLLNGDKNLWNRLCNAKSWEELQ